MARIEIGRYLTIDTRVCGGRLIFKGARILVSDVLELLHAGFTPEQISQEYRGLITPEAVREVLPVPKTKTAARFYSTTTSPSIR